MTLKEYITNEVSTDVNNGSYFVEVKRENRSVITAMTAADLLDSDADYLAEECVSTEKSADGYVAVLKNA